MAYLLDACVRSDLRKPQPSAKVISWFSGLQPEEAFLSVLTLGEIRRGVELRRAKDQATARALEAWLRGLEAHYADRILPITAAIADRWGRLSLSQPLPTTDGLIAATALEHKLTVVTRNTDDFARAGANLLNPF
ncbi:MAG: type II toxin-antitoxin system VapC family toxin [Opitutaceae bacterium]|nr:type II toxin-antitoxin system VapC family toxin [Opitutaceae bacterium]